VKRLLAISILLFSFLASASASASMLMPSGGWLINDELRVRTYTDFNLYRISAENIIDHDFEGAPITETITFVDTPFSSSSTALGYRHCSVKPFNTGIIAVYSFEKNIVTHSWIFDSNKFNSIPTNSVTCNKNSLMD
jgi:hypothetical protein